MDEFGDLPPELLKRLSQILSKRRAVTGRTLDLFLRPDLETVEIYDCGSECHKEELKVGCLRAIELETQDFVRIFSVVPNVQNLNLRNAGQFKDEVLDYIIERDVPIRNLQLDAANLISNQKWIEYFTKCGRRLESLKLSWLDHSMDDDSFTHLISACPNLKRLKIKRCSKLHDAAIGTIADLKALEHLSLRFTNRVSAPVLAKLITSIGSKLRTLSLEEFSDADDTVLSAIHSTCTNLEKFRFCENDLCTDAGYSSLFTQWPNSPLTFLDLSTNRSVDYMNPDGLQEDPTGVASSAFRAVMSHSGSQLETLDIASCRHIERDTFASIFNAAEENEYPNLMDLNISFLTKIDTPIVAGIFRSCPRLTKLTAFGCFNVVDVMVPKGVALIGVPNAQEAIVHDGEYDTDCFRSNA